MRIEVLALAALLLFASCTPAPPGEKLLEITDFELVDHHGKPFRSSQLDGAPSLLFFGYTHCPDACPAMMAKVSHVYRQLGEDGAKVPILFVSVDPRDKPDVLKRYLGYFAGVPALGLTGTKEQIDGVVKQFGATYRIRDTGSAAGPTVDHTVRLYLMDKQGDVVGLFDPTADPKEVADGIEAALRAQG